MCFSRLLRWWKSKTRKYSACLELSHSLSWSRANGGGSHEGGCGAGGCLSLQRTLLLTIYSCVTSLRLACNMDDFIGDAALIPPVTTRAKHSVRSR
jgi:hypothetical protein